jgi:nucleoside-diphosphate-sugar epimerase
MIQGQRYDPRWLHVEDAVQAFRRALAYAPFSRQFATTGPALHGWQVFHIPGGGAWTRVPLAAAVDAAFGYAPAHTFAGWPGSDRPAPSAGHTPPAPIPSRPIRRVLLLGAGGPLASAAIPLLAASYTLRLADLRPLREIVADARRGAGQPVPTLLGPPHELREVDVTDPAQVLAACEGVDAIVNCTVVRPHPVEAFRVNCLGAYHIMRAAVAHRIRRVVHTGPQQVTLDRPGGYWWDFDVPDEAPPRPGSLLYSNTKYLGQEVCRLFAEAYGLEVPVLLFSRFVDPATAQPTPDGVFPMTVSWEDAGHALRRALEVPGLPSPFEIFHILADLPHGKYSNTKARRLLGWRPRDTLVHLWARRS